MGHNSSAFLMLLSLIPLLDGTRVRTHCATIVSLTVEGW